MPDFYTPGEDDVAGFIVGIVARDRVLDGSRVREGDALVGLDSSGLHTNGYTLARRIVFEVMGLAVDDPFPGGERTVGEELLRVHRSYLGTLAPLLEEGRIAALAHITGGGVPGNLPRVLPEGLGAEIERGAWEVPEPFRTLERAGGVRRQEMDRVFNMGIGMIAVARPSEVDAVVERAGETGVGARRIGSVVAGSGVRYR